MEAIPGWSSGTPQWDSPRAHRPTSSTGIKSEMPEPNARSTYSALCEGEYAPPWWYRSFRP